ncbi:carboxylate transporter [Gemella sp. oral taxon 928]|nr:carboxylate transporter [Gemella sp. oral taxon 928]AXI27435.1 carboxylate transporter [Gemella sp. ND 6198]
MLLEMLIRVKWIFILLSVTISACYFFSATMRIGFLILISIFLLASNIVPAWYTGLLFFTSCIIGNLAPKEILLSGVISDASWLVISGIIIGSSVKYTKLDRVLARILLPICQGKYSKVLFGVMLLGVALLFLMPSAMSRIVLLLPILNALSEELGYKKLTKEWEGVLVMGILSTYIPAFYVLPSNVPNNVFIGIIQNLYATNISYSQYFLWYFPVLGIGKLIILYFIMLFFYKKCQDTKVINFNKMSLTKQQKILSVLLFITMVMWITEYIHKIPTGWTGMLTSLVCMGSGIGLVDSQPLRKINFEPFFYVAGIVSLGNVAKYSGIANLAAEYMAKGIELSTKSKVEVAIFIIVLCIILSFIVTLVGVPAIVTPLIEKISEVSNVSKEFLYKTEVLGFSNIFFPFQAPPLMVALQSENLSKTKMTLYCSIVSILGLALFPILALFWKILGV